MTRINKYLADKGFSTRRGADVLIEGGKVFINGKKAVIGQQVTETDTVEVRGVTQKEYRYYLYNKPKGVITHSPAAGEMDIVSKVTKDHQVKGIFPVGRLDKHSEGLMLLTDDGRVTDRLLSPKSGTEKEYLVTVDKRVTGYFLTRLSHGVSIEGYVTKPAQTKKKESNDHQFLITLIEGKKHQIRRMCAALGYQVGALKRVRIKDLRLGTIKPGELRELVSKQKADFLTSLGLS